jgi:Uncharacterized conserved protein (DUF2190)
MPQFVETPCKGLPAGSGVTIAAYLRVILNSAGQLAVAGANDYDIGVLDEAAFVQGAFYPVRLASAMGSFPCVASGPIGIGAPMFGDAGGKVTANAGNVPVGFALKAATANNDVIEGLRVPFLAAQNPNNFRNILDGGDFQTNPWQRGTSPISAVSNTVTYGPDRWFVLGAATSSIDGSKVAETSIPGFSQAFQWGRHAGNTDVNPISAGQVCETVDSIRMQGQKVTFSFWAKKGANYSGGAVTVQVISGTGTDQSAANMVAATWTGQANVLSSTFTPTGVMTRYQFTATVPVNATQVGVLLTYTPTGTAGANDNLLHHGFMLEDGAEASPYEFKDVEVELALAQRYFFQLNEANGANIALGAPTGTNTQGYSLWLPTPLRASPTVTVTLGGIKAIVDGAAPAAATGLAAGSAHSPSIISLSSTITLSAAAHSILLQGSGTTGKIAASADY